jgi:RNA polymerase sigma-70 factor, ECF subfamily
MMSAMDRTEIFDSHRRYLFGLAYRMVGSAADAEDLVQDCWLRWQQVEDPDAIRTPRAFLTTALTRLCINHMQSAAVRREQYVGSWLPEPLLTTGSKDTAELAESLSTAFLLLLESLSPIERAVFLLGEVFGYDAAEIAGIVDKSPANVRQILHRARSAVTERRPRFRVNTEVALPLLRDFRQALETANVEQMMSVLHADAVLYSDGGGKVKAALNPIYGAEKIARFFAGIREKGAFEDLRVDWAEINGLPGVVGWRVSTGKPAGTMTFETAPDGRVTAIYSVSNPDKLRWLKEAAEKC